MKIVDEVMKIIFFDDVMKIVDEVMKIVNNEDVNCIVSRRGKAIQFAPPCIFKR